MIFVFCSRSRICFDSFGHDWLTTQILFFSMQLQTRMAQVDTRLVAAQNFLQGLRSLPNFEDLRQQQFEKLLTLIRSKTLSFDQATVCLEKISEELCGNEFTLGLKQAVADQICELEAKADRTRQQDYRALPRYLDKAWFQVLAEATVKASALEHLVRLAKKLGLTKPSEPTYATLLALVFCHKEDEFLTQDQKWRLVQEFKPQMKKWFQQSCGVTHVVETLPRDVAEFPQELLRNAYPGGFAPIILLLLRGWSMCLKKRVHLLCVLAIL